MGASPLNIATLFWLYSGRHEGNLEELQTCRKSLTIYHNRLYQVHLDMRQMKLTSNDRQRLHTWLVEQGCGIAMPDSSDSYIEPAGQVDFPG